MVEGEDAGAAMKEEDREVGVLVTGLAGGGVDEGVNAGTSGEGGSVRLAGGKREG